MFKLKPFECFSNSNKELITLLSLNKKQDIQSFIDFFQTRKKRRKVKDARLVRPLPRQRRPDALRVLQPNVRRR